jgi:membrane protein
MLFLAPFIVIVLFAGSFAYSHALEYLGMDVEEFTLVKTIISWTIFGTLASLTFSAIYKFIPNAHVSYMNTLSAAIPAAIAFALVQYMYLETQVFVTRLNAIYGAFAAVPLFMIWLNIGWYIILIGAELSYAFQHVDSYNIED